jgi:uncharacterized protein (TIGR04141 family)
MASKQGLYPTIFRIDVDAARAFFGDEVPIVDIPQRIIDTYNTNKGVTTYELEGSATFDGCQLIVYRNARVHAQISPWVPFYEPSGITIKKVTAQNQHFVGFVVLDDELYAHTGGHSAVSFERFIDVSFPIDIARRIAEPEVKRARSSQISGTTLASDLNFRDPRRITYTESLENVWTALSGQVRPSVLADPGIRTVFGPKNKMRLEVSSAIKFGPRVDTLDKLIALIRWLAAIAESPMPDDDNWAILDSIKVLNPRKSKDLIVRLNRHLAKKFVVEHDYANIAVTHADASLYANATLYAVTMGQEDVYAGDRRPDLADILDHIEPRQESPESLLTSITVRSQCLDYGPEVGTYGTLLEHLHGEVRYDERTYFLLAGRWYEVDKSYIELVTRDFVGLIEDLDLRASQIGLPNWQKAKSEGAYNRDSVTGDLVINGDRVLTDNVELFDTLSCVGERTYIIHVKRDFDVKVRDVRSQIINSANIIENDLRLGDPARLKRHHAALQRRGRTTLTEAEFLDLFKRPRTYVLAYGTTTKVERATVDQFGSIVARMEVVTLGGQFRQIASASHATELRIAWIEIAD